MKFFESFFWMACLRVLLLLRQKLGWMSLVVGVLLLFLSMVVARVSFVKPEKIFWDFSLGLSFSVQVLLSTYLASHVVQDEKDKKTLHMLLASGLSRWQWILGQLAGLGSGLFLMNMLWLIVSLLLSFFVFSGEIYWIVFQAQFLVAVEIFVLLALSLFASLWVRPALAWMGALSLTLLLHSYTTLLSVFEETVYKFETSTPTYQSLLKIVYFFPPLEWFDLRDFVGYQAQIAWESFLGIFFLGVTWFFFLSWASLLRFQRLDL